MWVYEKALEFPVKINKPDLRMAKLLFAQYGGPDSELGAACRYLSQRFTMPDERCKAMLTDIGTEELAHWEMIGTMIHQCMRGATIASIRAAGLESYYVQHGLGVYPCGADGVPFSASTLQCDGDPVADLTEDMAAEQKARVAYEHLLTMTDDVDLRKPLIFLREREIVHFQRFGEALGLS